MSEAQIGSAKQDEISDMEVRTFIDRVADLMKLEILHSLTAKASPSISALKLAPLMVGNKSQKSYPSVGMAVDNWVEKKAPAARSQILKRALERPPLSPTLKAFEIIPLRQVRVRRSSAGALGPSGASESSPA